MEAWDERRVLIVGAGVGGLATALALRRVGIEAVVFERAAGLEKVQLGAGLMLWTSALRALQTLGLGERVEAIGGRVESFEVQTWRGGLLSRWPVGEMGRALGAPTVCVGRADLHAALFAALPAGVVQFAAPCVGFTQDARGVTARFADGRAERGAALIGADGINSVVRAQLLGPRKPRYAGYTAWRAVVGAEHALAPPGFARVVWGPGARLIYYPIGGGRQYWLALVKAPEGQPPAGSRKLALLARYRGWVAPVEALLAAAEEAAILHHDVYDRPPARRWGAGRVTLLGDAAHAMTPNLAHGACEAIEGAVVLARCLLRERETATALRGYERERRGRTAKFQNQSWAVGATSRWEHPLLCAARDGIMRTMLNTVSLRQQWRDMDYAF